MIEQLNGLPAGTIGLQATGVVTAGDYREVLVPAVEQALRDHRKIRMLYVAGPDFDRYDAGALWQDAKLGMEHLPAFERVAIVTDADWIRRSVAAFRFLIPAEVQVFPVAEQATAREWIGA